MHHHQQSQTNWNLFAFFFAAQLWFSLYSYANLCRARMGVIYISEIIINQYREDAKIPINSRNSQKYWNKAKAWHDRFNCYFLLSPAPASHSPEIKKNQLNLKLNERKEKKRNQTILSTSFGRDYNKCRSQCIASGVVRNFSSFIQIGRTQITLFKVLLSFFPWKQVPPNMCAPVSWHRKYSVFFDLVCFELRRSQNLSHDLVSSTDLIFFSDIFLRSSVLRNRLWEFPAQSTTTVCFVGVKQFVGLSISGQNLSSRVFNERLWNKEYPRSIDNLMMCRRGPNQKTQF